MSLPARSALIAAGSCWNVYFTPGGPLTARSFEAIALPLLDLAAIAPRMHIIAASNSFTSSDCRCALPGNAEYIESNAFVSRAPRGTAGRVPRAPSTEPTGDAAACALQRVLRNRRRERRALPAADEELGRVELARAQELGAVLSVRRGEGDN